MLVILVTTSFVLSGDKLGRRRTKGRILGGQRRVLVHGDLHVSLRLLLDGAGVKGALGDLCFLLEG